MGDEGTPPRDGRARPAGMSWESWVDRQIREAMERGEFDALPKGPLPGLDGRYDENWWLKRKLEQENLSVAPRTLQVRLEVDRELRELAAHPGEASVRKRVRELNGKIAEANRGDLGPLRPQPLLVEEEIVERWRRTRDRERRGKG